jgi:ubiquinone/menaquinone biosynthesis C-methylase UbiE
MLKAMKAAGCWQISYGVETGSQRLLDLIHKGIRIDRIEKTFSLTKEVGISIRAFFMLGLPTETRAESLKTIALAKRLDARWSQFTLFTPFPGTRLYDKAVRERGLRSEKWSDFKTHGGWTRGGLAYVPRGRSSEEMKRMQKRAYRAVYMRPRVFFRFMRDVDSPAKIIEYALGLWVLLKTLLPERRRARVPRIEREDLRRFGEGVYVDSPVYFARNPLVRAFNWRKLDQAASLLAGESNEPILDFCCGNGVMLPFLSGRYRKVVGLDRYPSAARRMRTVLHLEGVSLTAADGLKLPFRDGAFYGILALSALEHFEDLDGIVKEMARVIRAGGFVLYLSPTENRFYRLGRWLCGYVKPRDHHHSGAEVEATLRKHFDSEIMQSLPWFLPPFLGVYRVGRMRRRTGSSRTLEREKIREERSGEPGLLSFT